MSQRKQKFTRAVVEWARQGHLRVYPWRLTRDPYVLLVTEVMLRRTRADNVVPVFTTFFAKWPSPELLGKADPQEITLVLRPLGLRWRGENILELRDKMGEVARQSYSELLNLPGVGDYVASAVSCFARNEVRPLVDTNSVRVISRFFGLPFGPETRRRKPFRELASELVSREEPIAYNLALLDIAALACRPAKPVCNRCPLNIECMYARKLEGSSE